MNKKNKKQVCCAVMPNKEGEGRRFKSDCVRYSDYGYASVPSEGSDGSRTDVT